MVNTILGLEIVRFHAHYYIRRHQYNGSFTSLRVLSEQIIARIPRNRNKYKKWLRSMRTEYRAKELALEKHVHQICDESKPDYSKFAEFVALPSELPRLDEHCDAKFFYIINLDKGILTMNHTIHWSLCNIPHQSDLSRSTSTLAHKKEHMTSPALEIPNRNRTMGYAYRVVTPKTNIEEPRKAFLTFVLARTLIEYHKEISRYGREWAPGTFPSHELIFAFVSIASGQARLHSFPEQPCNPRNCRARNCKWNHLPRSPGWLSKPWAGASTPLLEFGSPSHRPGEPAGASPTETMYWFKGVLVSLTLVVDEEAISDAVTWGIEQKRTNFQMVILSLFKVAFAEVSLDNDGDGKPVVRLSESINLSPIRAEHCAGAHPRERPAGWKDEPSQPGHSIHRCAVMVRATCTGTAQELRENFPGLAALVNFFDAATNRLLYHRILDFTDYDTWHNCSVVSPQLHAYCLFKYRLDDRLRIVAGPFAKLQGVQLLSFDFEDLETGEILPMMQVQRHCGAEKYRWMPLIGGERKALMVDVVVQFGPADDVPVGEESGDRRT
ncbi:uncharacterized protein B0H64DRAFT_415832 [Chaetomium fimeti]|uniref:Uncharacterized protein n=1 Tax=Chaetomium fimeti TaxID=1854472 RepID=A0AAE0HN29_9PEZI|nr:hypothetical protein B0H64DRAFT_415832 [Chaetomium fimeti]